MTLNRKQIIQKILSLKKFPITVKTKLAIQRLQQKIADLDERNSFKKN